MTPPVALTIAGSDSGGGAGIQADLRTFAALGVFGTTAITCVTAQNTARVNAVHVLPAAFVRAQIEAVIEDMTVSGAKTGVLYSEEIVREVAALAPSLPALVVDPVLVASTGRRLTDDGAVRAYREVLLPAAAVATPNLLEASVLLGEKLETLDDARRAARRLGDLAPVVVVKGGHGNDPSVSVDVVWDGQLSWEITQPRIATTNTHGAGCTFSAAIAAGLARHLSVKDAIEHANTFVHQAIQGSAGWCLGAGAGPLDQFGGKEEEK
jgi:hydroxymethylpyrimidine/phosphomethylpyrimidine kinase